ncbi:MAG: DUF6457 domain-containing protein [Microbacteriaceae bacterium]
MSDREQEDQLLAEWCRRLEEELGIPGLTLDQPAILGLAGRAAHAVVRPAAPLTTFIVGYAAGSAAAGDATAADAAIASAMDAASRLCRSLESGSAKADAEG